MFAYGSLHLLHQFLVDVFLMTIGPDMNLVIGHFYLSTIAKSPSWDPPHSLLQDSPVFDFLYLTQKCYPSCPSMPSSNLNAHIPISIYPQSTHEISSLSHFQEYLGVLP